MFSYAEVANRTYRPGPTPATPSIPRSASYTSVASLRNVTNTAPQAVVVRASGSPMVPQQRAFTMGNTPVAVAIEDVSNARKTPVAVKENAPNLFNVPTASAAVKANGTSAAGASDVTSSTRTARPKRKAAVDAPKTWESEKKKSRGSKKARVDAGGQRDASVNNAKAAGAEQYFATPPPSTPPPANTFISVRQPAPRENAKFRSYDVVWSDGPSSTLSDDAEPTQEVHQLSARNTPGEDYVTKRREMKARKKVECTDSAAGVRAAGGPSRAAAVTSGDAAASSSAAPVVANVNKQRKRRRSSGNDVHRLALHKKGKGKGKERAPPLALEPGKKKGKKHLTSHDGTDEESQRGCSSGDEASEESEDAGSECGGGSDLDTFENAEDVVECAQPFAEDSEAPNPPTRRPGCATKRIQEETVTVIRSPVKNEGVSVPAAPQNGAVSPFPVSHPPDAARFADAFPHVHDGYAPLCDAYPPLSDGSLLINPLPPLPDPFPPLPGPAELPTAFPALHEAFPPLSATAQPASQAPQGAVEPSAAFPPLHEDFPPLSAAAQPVSQALQTESIEIVNPSHPKYKDQPLPVRMALRSVWARACAAILKNNLLMEHADRNRVVAGLGVQAALDLGLPHMADRLRDTQGPYYAGWYRLTMERMSALRGNMKAAIKEALELYNVPPYRKDGSTEAVVEYLFADRRYIFPDLEVPHWETAYMHPAIVTALRCLLFETIRPAEMPIAAYDRELFNPPDDAYRFEMEIPASVLASVATLIYYALDCRVRDPNGKNQPDITEDKYRREYGFHKRSMENLRQMPRIRHERLNWLYNAVQSQLENQDQDTLTWG